MFGMWGRVLAIWAKSQLPVQNAARCRPSPSAQFQSVSAAGVKKSPLQSHPEKESRSGRIDEDEDESMDVEELDLDDAQAERHWNEAMSGDDDDEVDLTLAEVNEFDEKNFPDEVEVVADDDDDDSDELEDDLEDEDD